ncbi:formylglycine-generating enzyme family protein [Anaeromicropila populeti]|uniref:Formylglycine-generating enzyme, required for sulfatase activity, contains SUMF1/FGE domain n=1 Tax=Anaeromicropila populeti TaxID=37658 RepID=A0A1I6KRA0_9FIRM|nr:formylglycine-generating enzyme family protein [Anaeromicropila populeti]SFR93528.1 Formylglycine-generating enzyme, required for sulfatase activity, contains SUMF1/FGE domain [Anaeromicropila populeti]
MKRKSLIAIFLFLIITFLVFIVINSLKSNKNDFDNEIEKVRHISLGDYVTMDFVRIEAGTFWMGSDAEIGDSDETPKHMVTITQPFYIGKYEVTQEQWQEVMGTNPSEFIGEHNPVDSVSWEECQVFLKKLEEITGFQYVLPTEAQWEYACRAGTNTAWHFGEDDSLLSQYAWCDTDPSKMTHPVGEKKPNEWGLYDMYGNVQEWCSDWYENKYLDENSVDPLGPSTGDSKVLRGGGWGESALYLRSAYRNCNGVEGKNNGIGFRCVMLIR